MSDKVEELAELVQACIVPVSFMSSPAARFFAQKEKQKFKFGQRVRKVKGSSWQGHIVGFYVTALTPEGYAVESEREPGSVQIYPASALEAVE